MRQNSRKRKLIDYYKKNLKKGYTPDSLKYALINQGYLRLEVESCLEEAQKEIAESAPKLKDKPQITYQVVDHEDNLVKVQKKSFWSRIFWE